MNIYLRGSLGTQILQLMGGFAKSYEDCSFVTDIIHSVGNLPAEHSKINYVENLFDLSSYIEKDNPFNKTKEIVKSPSWDYDNIKLILKHRERILDTLSAYVEKPHGKVHAFHARFGDRQLLSDIEYATEFQKQYDRSFEKRYFIFVITDDRSKAIQLGMTPFLETTRRAEDEWIFGLNEAKTIIGSLSTFTFSMLMLNPEKEILFFPKERSNGPHKMEHGEFELMDRLFQEKCFPNAGWLR